MAEIEEELSIEIDNTYMEFEPCKQGCRLVFYKLNLNQQESAALTWLMMNGPILKLEISKA